MRKTRLLRILLLALLVPFVLLVAFTFRKPVRSPEPAEPGASGVEIRGAHVVVRKGGRVMVEADVEHMETLADGSYEFEGIRELVVPREGSQPLLISADKGRVEEGEDGAQHIRLEGKVRLTDEEEGLSLSLPALEVDRGAQEARSLGQVDFRGRDYHGSAPGVTYSLDDRPSVLRQPHLVADDGSTLTAERGVLLDGLKDIELVGSVHVTQPGREFDAERMRVQRDEEGRLRQIVAESATMEQDPTPEQPLSSLRGDQLEVGWDLTGEPAWLQVAGDALMRQGPSTLIAEHIEAESAELGGWAFVATGNVLANSVAPSGLHQLSTSELRGRVDDRGVLLDGEAIGAVEFHSSDVQAEAARAGFHGGLAERIELFAEGDRRARMARARSRIAAEHIVTNRSGSELSATGRVEASLLPVEQGSARAQQDDGLFRGDEAVHFVARRLDGDLTRNVLVFTGAVRGWQGDRNLSAQRVELDQAQDRLHAFEHVMTRLPKAQGPAASSSDFVQLTADELDYRGLEHRAHYIGNARARQSEGWVEADELQIDLQEQGGGIEELRGLGQVRFEFRDLEGGDSAPPSTGSGDRLVYRPDIQRIVLFGDQAPAEVRRSGGGGDNASGRVITYHLDTGSWEVNEGTIRSSRGP